jgi:SAM-dependent methyltransferase
MGIAYSYVKKMETLGLLRNGMRVLDIGSSNLYSASEEDVKTFLATHSPRQPADLDAFAARLAYGSGYDPVKGGRNEAFIGELFEKAGMEYLSFDIASGFRTTILDLNRAALPSPLRNKFDLVLNFGTTEHILNQLNCFKVIHDATKVGGCMFHSLPAVGYVDHGYITYTGRCFFDIGGNNEYEMLACWFDGSPGTGGTVLDSLRSYSSYFPALGRTLEEYATSDHGRFLADFRVPDISINVVYRKVKAKPFWGALEASTSVGHIPGNVTAAYSGEAEAFDAPPAGETGIKARVAAMLQGHPRLYRLVRNTYRAMNGSER